MYIMNNIWQDLKKPIFALAPMEDVTDSVFRQVVADCAKPDLFFTEFTNADGLQSEGRVRIINRLRFTDKERPIIAQFWGKNPDNIYLTSREIKKMGFSGIDINMGCPEKAVIRQGCGGALIENQDLVLKIISAAKLGSGGLPVSVKTRIGFNRVDTEAWISFLLSLKLDAITIHGRRVKDSFEIPANWDEIGKAVKIRDQVAPETIIIGNGDIGNYQEGLEKVQKYRVDGVMIARGVFQNPFIFDKTGRFFNGTKERLDLLLKHTRLFVATWGKEKNFSILKKFFKVYISSFEGATKLRGELMQTSTLEEVEEIVAHCKSTLSFVT